VFQEATTTAYSCSLAYTRLLNSEYIDTRHVTTLCFNRTMSPMVIRIQNRVDQTISALTLGTCPGRVGS